MSTRGLLTPAERAELAAQSDMRERARRLMALRQAQGEGCYVYDARRGMHLWVKTVDGTTGRPLDAEPLAA